jgi:hypothetical protein
MTHLKENSAQKFYLKDIGLNKALPRRQGFKGVLIKK